MGGYQQVLKVKEAAEARLRALPGAHAVGIGRKVVGGKPTDALAITVFVEAKKDASQLLPGDVIPAEIDGIETDVVEMPRPRLLMAANPANLVPTVSANQLSVTFSGTDKPGGGLLVLLFFTAGSTGSPPGDILNLPLQTVAETSLADIAAALSQALTSAFAVLSQKLTGGGSPVVFSASATGPQITIAANAGFACALTRCTVTAVDDARYFEDWIRGGIQIEMGGTSPISIGTLGCIATTPPTPQDPQGKVVAITCQHVVAAITPQPTNLTITLSGHRIIFANNSAAPILPNTLVKISFENQARDVFYGTHPGDTPSSVANGVATAITNLGDGLSASAGGPGGIVVTVTGAIPDGGNVFAPPAIDQGADLTASVVGTTVRFTGEVSGDDYGIYTSVNSGGISASFGVYTNPAKGATLSSIAQAVAKAISDLDATIRGTVTASPTDAQVTMSNAQEVDCIIKSDGQVGQPDNSFGSTCSHCCSHRIGRVIDARLDIDIALIQLDAGQKYKPGIQDFPLLLTGTRILDPPADLNAPVMKRGRTTGLTWGQVDQFHVSGDAGESGGFQRHYTNAMRITTASSIGDPFSSIGDSGSAVFNVGGEVVGILFSGGSLGSMVTPIERIETAFAPAILDFAPAPVAGQSPDDVRVVPKAAMDALPAIGIPSASAPAFVGRQLTRVEQELAATSAGRDYAQVVKRHFAETVRLVNSNRRVATVWHRNGGPQILEAVLRALQRRDQRLPEEINGMPFGECLERIKRAISRYASPSLAADLSRLTPGLARFAGLTYAQMLSALRSGGAT